MARQLHFDLPPRDAMGAGDYFVSEANAIAAAMLGDDAAWPAGKLVVTGPHASGKTHLVRLWAARTGADVRLAATLDAADPLPAPGTRIAIEDAEALPWASEEYLFHLHNHLAATNGRLLLTARQPPTAWPVRLPDLASRLQGTTVVRIDDPDDALLRAVLTKQFADRQLNPSPRLIAYVLSRIERSFAAAGAFVAAMDEAALSGGGVMNLSLARAILDIGCDPAQGPVRSPQTDGTDVP